MKIYSFLSRSVSLAFCFSLLFGSLLHGNRLVQLYVQSLDEMSGEFKKLSDSSKKLNEKKLYDYESSRLGKKAFLLPEIFAFLRQGVDVELSLPGLNFLNKNLAERLSTIDLTSGIGLLGSSLLSDLVKDPATPSSYKKLYERVNLLYLFSSSEKLRSETRKALDKVNDIVDKTFSHSFELNTSSSFISILLRHLWPAAVGYAANTYLPKCSTQGLYKKNKAYCDMGSSLSEYSWLLYALPLVSAVTDISGIAPTASSAISLIGSALGQMMFSLYSPKMAGVNGGIGATTESISLFCNTKKYKNMKEAQQKNSEHKKQVADLYNAAYAFYKDMKRICRKSGLSKKAKKCLRRKIDYLQPFDLPSITPKNIGKILQKLGQLYRDIALIDVMLAITASMTQKNTCIMPIRLAHQQGSQSTATTMVNAFSYLTGKEKPSMTYGPFKIEEESYIVLNPGQETEEDVMAMLANLVIAHALGVMVLPEKVTLGQSMIPGSLPRSLMLSFIDLGKVMIHTNRFERGDTAGTYRESLFSLYIPYKPLVK